MGPSNHSRRDVIAGATAALLAPAVLPLAAAAQDSKTLRAVVHADLKILDPVSSNTWITVRHCYLICDTLYGMNSKLEPQPQMVERHEIDADGLNYRFTLRDGLAFHDGQPVRAADVVASLQRWMRLSGDGKTLAKFVDRVEAAGERVFTFKMKEPYGLVLETLARPSAPAFIFPERIVAQVKDGEQLKETIGSGPFMFAADEWQPGSRVVYKRNPNYKPRSEPADFLSGGKVAHLDRVEWRTMPDANTAMAALQAGEVDYFEVPPLDFIALAERNPDLKTQVIDAIGLHLFIRPNFLQAPFSDVRARQALALLVNQDNFLRVAVGNPKLYKQCFAYFMCGTPNATDIGSEPYRQPNVARAKELLQEAGYKGEKLVLMTPSKNELPVIFGAAQFLAQTLTQAGVVVETVVLDWASFVARRNNRGTVAEGGWSLFVSIEGGPDPATPVLNYWFNSTCGASAQGWPCDKQLEDLLVAYARERNAAARKDIVDRLQKRAYEYFPQILLGQYIQPVITRANVEGVLPASQAVYWNIRKT